MRDHERAERRGQGAGKKSLTAEEAAWHDIAERTGKSVGEAKRATTATEFWRWAARRERAYGDVTPDQFYLAQLSMDINCLPFRVWGKTPPAGMTDLKAYLLKFSTADGIDDGVKEVRERQAAETQAALSRNTWLALLGLDDKGERVVPLVTRQPPPPKDGARPESLITRAPRHDLPSTGNPPQPPPDRAPEGQPATNQVRVFLRGSQ